MQAIIALISGLLFGLGLAITQMVNPNKVLNFLDIAGHWDPSLILVMGCAVLLYAIGYFCYVKKSRKPLLADQYSVPTNRVIDKKLVSGALIFGLGWGLAGICPGPAIANLLSGELKIIAFVLAMIVGMLLADSLQTRKT